MASMYTSSNQYPLPNALAAQCRTKTTTAIEATAAVANGGTRRSVATPTAAEVTYRHDTVVTMALRVDPQVRERMDRLTDALGESDDAPVGDVERRRINGHRMFDFIGATSAPVEGVRDRRVLGDREGRHRAGRHLVSPLDG